jgi:hypothetical protein
MLRTLSGSDDEHEPEHEFESTIKIMSTLKK